MRSVFTRPLISDKWFNSSLHAGMRAGFRCVLSGFKQQEKFLSYAVSFHIVAKSTRISMKIDEQRLQHSVGNAEVHTR